MMICVEYTDWTTTAILLHLENTNVSSGRITQSCVSDGVMTK